jgi:hypothetical protein
MITQRSPLQDFQTLYIGGVELAVVRRAIRGQIWNLRDCEGSFTAVMVHIIQRSESGEQARG